MLAVGGGGLVPGVCVANGGVPVLKENPGAGGGVPVLREEVGLPQGINSGISTIKVALPPAPYANPTFPPAPAANSFAPR